MKIRHWILGLLLVALIYLFLKRGQFFKSLSSLFKSQPVLIDETPVFIKQINDLAKLVTISFYDEIVMDSSKPKNLPSFPGLRPVPDHIVLLAKGTVLAGIDLKKIDSGKVFVLKDSVNIVLPPAEILNTIINPSNFEVFDEEGKWSFDEVLQIKQRMIEKIRQRAIENNALPKADARAKQVLEKFLRGVGFKKVSFE
ncbi:MAG: DUF4230 domain-containing protein [Ginsengibacter sp.]